MLGVVFSEGCPLWFITFCNISDCLSLQYPLCAVGGFLVSGCGTRWNMFVVLVVFCLVQLLLPSCKILPLFGAIDLFFATKSLDCADCSPASCLHLVLLSHGEIISGIKWPQTVDDQILFYGKVMLKFLKIQFEKVWTSLAWHHFVHNFWLMGMEDIWMECLQRYGRWCGWTIRKNLIMVKIKTNLIMSLSWLKWVKHFISSLFPQKNLNLKRHTW